MAEKFVGETALNALVAHINKYILTPNGWSPGSDLGYTQDKLTTDFKTHQNLYILDSTAHRAFQLTNFKILYLSTSSSRDIMGFCIIDGGILYQYEWNGESYKCTTINHTTPTMLTAAEVDNKFS